MTAKMKSKPHRKNSRPDWDRVRVKVMRWCLRMKLAQNWAKFSELLLRTDDRPIVEESRRDDFWGAKPVDHQTLVGMNVLGRLLMELREAVKSHGRDACLMVEPPDIPEFLLLGRPIMGIGKSDLTTGDTKAAPSAVTGGLRPMQDGIEQASLFDAPSAREAPSPVYVAQRAPERALLGDLKPYPVVKDSGVPWLGHVPEQWQVSPAFAAYRPRQVKNTGLVESTVLSLSYGRIVIKAPEKLRGLVPESFETYQIVEPGNIIVRTTDLQNDQTSLRVGHARHRGIITAAYMCLETKPIVLNEFGYQYLNAYDLLKIIYGFGSGLRQNLDFSDIKRMPVLVPPRDEQAAIVRFLDHADRRIRRYIRAKQKLIKLLDEQKQAIIHRAVTRGLDPNVRLKPSGVESLGDVPEHWEVSRVKNELYCLNRRRVPLSATQRGAMTLRKYDYYGASGVIDRVDEYLFDDDLLLIAEDGANLVLRNLPLAITAHGKFWVNNHAHILKPRRGNLEYLAAVMERINYQPWISGAAQPKLTQDRLMGIAIAVAPPGEQDQIAKVQNEGTAPLRATIERARREIDLLREYRTRLIADVVTGKLDVREAAARLPDEVEETEPIDEIEAEGGTDEVGADDTDAAPEEAEA